MRVVQEQLSQWQGPFRTPTPPHLLHLRFPGPPISPEVTTPGSITGCPMYNPFFLLLSCSYLTFHSLIFATGNIWKYRFRGTNERTGSYASKMVCLFLSLKYIAQYNRLRIGAMAGFSSVTQFLLAIVGQCSIIPVTFPPMSRNNGQRTQCSPLQQFIKSFSR